MTARPASLRPSRRAVVITLHWLTAFLLLAMLKGGTGTPVVRWTFAAAAALWVVVALAKGLAGRPGPKLSGAARALYRPMHWGLYALLAAAAALNAAELAGLIAPGPAWISLLVLLSAGTLHGLFHFWRHTALRDNALRSILPKSLHHIL
ncbi:hypothetical protein [Histidinibacterium lentulum]|uniref:Cytochrome B n=1 Tax=Histidinibacterium lentulum TaxID=2480588 RepID=A0A3N2QL02_9RHOB|nr:hypothetical protein [Histidinibacterium lentulum]ROT95876.1 hypothetical protein EAT49_19660 [Histidinibacterium lentulum]